LIFFLLVFALTIPFWVLCTMVKVEGLPDNLPVTDIGASFVPLIAASILVYREEKFGGVKKLLRRAFDYKKSSKDLVCAHHSFDASFILADLLGNAPDRATTPPNGIFPFHTPLLLLVSLSPLR
jgi:hypothetical protein